MVCQPLPISKTMKTLAIIGTGIAGMACGYHLQKRFDLTVYEKNDYVGGHTNTVEVEEAGKRLPIDTGFMVYNEVTYPHLVQLFKELGVRTKPTSMSFSVQYKPTGLEFCGSGMKGLFAQRRNLFRPSYWVLLSEINRFNKQAIEVLVDPRFAKMTLRDYARVRAYSTNFLDQYLIPMSSAVWSTPPSEMLDFPAVSLVQFFKNHGFLGLDTQHPWYTVEGGSREYQKRLTEGFRDRIRVSTPATRVARRDGKVWVTDASGQTAAYDLAILASHADESLALLESPTENEKRLLSLFHYQENIATLHTDSSVMPKTRAAWSSWNYRTDANGSTTIYWMNSLQGVSDQEDYFVSIGDPKPINASKIRMTLNYTHPIFSVAAMRAQKELPMLNEGGPVYFCGSYFRYGFHEDALVSALDLVKHL